MDRKPSPEAVIVQQKRGISGAPGESRQPGQSEIRQLGNVAWVSLSRGLWAEIDAADIPLIAGVSWSAVPGLRVTYAWHKSRARGRIAMHRVIAGAKDRELCDHRDCDGLNNRRSNLRKCTHAENAGNQRMATSNKSGFKGVFAATRGAKWHAAIKVDGRSIHLGVFPTPREAHGAYVKAAERFNGEFARVG